MLSVVRGVTWGLISSPRADARFMWAVEYFRPQGNTSVVFEPTAVTGEGG